MAQPIVERVIGRLITDEEFRSRFMANPEGTLLALRDTGLDLSRTEVAALAGTDRSIWQRAADAIDPRLQKASLETDIQ